jgi:hypothetical protein
MAQQSYHSCIRYETHRMLSSVKALWYTEFSFLCIVTEEYAEEKSE